MANQYKLPRCWLAQQIQEDGVSRSVRLDEIEPDCKCTTPMAAFYCMTGHMTECHPGKTCREAECSHLKQYDPPEDGGLFDEEDL
jgi:hypothetical protein